MHKLPTKLLTNWPLSVQRLNKRLKCINHTTRSQVLKGGEDELNLTELNDLSTLSQLLLLEFLCLCIILIMICLLRLFRLARVHQTYTCAAIFEVELMRMLPTWLIGFMWRGSSTNHLMARGIRIEAVIPKAKSCCICAYSQIDPRDTRRKMNESKNVVGVFGSKNEK